MKPLRKSSTVHLIASTFALAVLLQATVFGRTLVPLNPGDSTQTTRLDFEEGEKLNEEQIAELERAAQELEAAKLEEDAALIAAKEAEIAALTAAREETLKAQEELREENPEDFSVDAARSFFTETPKESSINEVLIDQEEPVVVVATATVTRPRRVLAEAAPEPSVNEVVIAPDEPVVEVSVMNEALPSIPTEAPQDSSIALENPAAAVATTSTSRKRRVPSQIAIGSSANRVAAAPAKPLKSFTRTITRRR
jgi:hypothetical protein